MHPSGTGRGGVFLDSLLINAYISARNRVDVTGKAAKQLARLEDLIAVRIVLALKTLRHWPDCRNVKALSGREGYRLRVGSYRVLFTVHGGEIRVIRVEEVKKRDESTYR